MDTFESREQTLGELVTVKWLQQNHGSGLHLEQYDPDKLHSLMLSRIRKLSREINVEHSRDPLPIRTESLDKIFDSILKSGLLTPVHEKVSSESEKRKIREEAEADQFIADSNFKAQITELERRGGQRAVSEWLHGRATPKQKKQFQRVFDLGVKQPESPAPQQAALFLIKATDRVGRVRFVCSDNLRGGIALNGDPANAFRFGNSRANHFAGLLAQQRPELKEIEIVPV